jgi:hypothetical protein
MRDTKQGAQFFSGATVGEITKVNTGSGKDRIAHYQNLVLNLTTAGGTADWSFFLPMGARTEDADGIRIIQGEQTWIALRPINLQFSAPDGKSDKKWMEAASYPQGMKAKGTGGRFCGFAMEVGDARSHGSYDGFKKAIQGAKLDVSALEDGKATYAAANGRSVGIAIVTNQPLPRVFRDGQERVFDESTWALWQPSDGGKPPISLGWKKGQLHVEAGGATFQATYTPDGKYTFESKF